MKERPIIFNAPMVRAILNGTKTQTRRVVKPQSSVVVLSNGAVTIECWVPELRCPYGTVGQRLWVRETYRFDGLDPKLALRSQCLDEISYRADMEGDRCCDDCAWRPSIFMPRWASRLTLEITAIRVERLQDISEEDAIAEGIHKPAGSQFWCADPSANILPGDTPKWAYRNLWESINGAGSWDANPFVWVLEFKRVEDVK